MHVGSLKMVVRRLMSPALMAYVIKGVNVGTSFLATLILARIAGAAVIGHYSLAVASGTLVSMFALRGLDQILLRQISGDLREEKPGKAYGTLRVLTRSITLSSLLLMTGYTLVIGLSPVADWLATDRMVMVSAVIGIISVALLRVSLATTRAAGLPVAGQFFEGLPSIVFLFSIVVLWASNIDFTAILAVLLFFGSQIVATIINSIFLQPKVRDWRPAQAVASGPLYRAGLPIMLAVCLAQATDWLLLAGISNVDSVAEVGAFRVAVQMMMVLATIVATGETYIASFMAGDIRMGRPDLARKKYKQATLLMVAVGVIPVLLCVFIPGWILGFVFGPDFAVAGPALAIMAVGQAIALLCGPVGALLVMSGKEKLLLWQALAAFFIVAVLSIILIPRYGLTGAAIAYAVTIGFRKLMALFLALRLIVSQPAH